MVTKNSGYLIQSNLGTRGNNFEVVVPVIVPEGNGLQHWYRDNGDPTLPWVPTRTFGVIGAGVSAPSVIQSNLGRQGNNFELIVPVGAETLQHWYRDNGDPTLPWVPTRTFASQPYGCALIQSNLGTRGNDFEVVVNEGGIVGHWRRDNGDPTFPWVKTGTFANDVDGAPALIQSNLGTRGNNFEVVVRVGNELQHWYRDNGDPTLPWVPTRTFANDVTSSPALIQSNLGTRGNNFEVVIPVGGGRLQHWYRDNGDPTLPWVPTRTFASGVATFP